MTIGWALLPRTAGMAAAAARTAGFGSGRSGALAAATPTPRSRPAADSAWPDIWVRSSGAIGLRLDPADFSRLVVDFGGAEP